MQPQRKIFFSQPPHNIFCEELRPAKSGQKKQTFLFIHGGYHTGLCYTQTPDGRPGWAPLLAAQGHTAIVTDVPGMGRSGAVAFDRLNGTFAVEGYINLIRSLPEKKIIVVCHSMSGPFGLKIAEALPGRISHVIAIEPALPGDLEPVVVPFYRKGSVIKARLKHLVFMLDMHSYVSPSPQLIRSFTVEHTTQFPKTRAALTQYTASLQQLHPRFVYERLNIEKSQIRIDDYRCLRNTTFVIVTSHKNPIHKTEDARLVDTLRMAGVPVHHLRLGQIGFPNNGHMMMIEKKNDRILDAIVRTVRQAAE